jgi:ABC-type nitrate/sulfonate/bicarbonate transport system permease component
MVRWRFLEDMLRALGAMLLLLPLAALAPLIVLTIFL